MGIQANQGFRHPDQGDEKQLSPRWGEPRKAGDALDRRPTLEHDPDPGLNVSIEGSVPNLGMRVGPEPLPDPSTNRRRVRLAGLNEGVRDAEEGADHHLDEGDHAKGGDEDPGIERLQTL